MNETKNETPNLISGNPNASENVTSDETTSVNSTTGDVTSEVESTDESSVESTTSEATSSVEGMSWHPEASLEVLPKAGIGMVVIFAIIGVIILTTAILGKVTSKKKDK